MKEQLRQYLPLLFQEENLKEQSIGFFEILNYCSDRRFPPGLPTDIRNFRTTFPIQNQNRFSQTNDILDSIEAIYPLFQLSPEETGLTEYDDQNIYSYLFFAVRLADNTYSRTQLSQITRNINKRFAQPILILFTYIDGDEKKITISISDRRPNRRDETLDVIEKVTLIKDINVLNPHRAHIDILSDFAFSNLDPRPETFDDLHQVWKKTLSMERLNKKFYKELSHWYFWALEHVDFPRDQTDYRLDRVGLFPNLELQQEQKSVHLLRLLTRLLFIWFMKEKALIPTYPQPSA